MSTTANSTANSTAKTTAKTTAPSTTAPTHIWYHNSRKRIYDIPVDDRWEAQWEKQPVVEITSRSYVLQNGVKVPKNPKLQDPTEIAMTDDALSESVWNHYNYLRVTSALSAMARGNPSLTRDLDALLAKYA